MEIKDIYINPKNPRYIRDERFKKLKESIKGFPKMMKLRPIVVDDNGMILGGNMRYLAIKDLGYQEIPDGWVIKASELTEEERKRFKIVDNIPFGDWDYDKLANEWELEELQDWGVEIPEVEMEDEEKIENIEAYKRIHILISVDVDYYNEISQELEVIKSKIIGNGEYEQTAN